MSSLNPNRLTESKQAYPAAVVVAHGAAADWERLQPDSVGYYDRARRKQEWEVNLLHARYLCLVVPRNQRVPNSDTTAMGTDRRKDQCSLLGSSIGVGTQRTAFKKPRGEVASCAR
jgi:hypothetical protein